MLRNLGKPFFGLLFIATIYAAVCTQTRTLAQTVRSTLPVPSLRYFDLAWDVPLNTPPAVGFNPATNRIYVFGYVSGEPQFGYSTFNGQPNKALTVLDATNYSQLGVIPIEFFNVDSGAIAINPQTNRIYVTEGYEADTNLAVVDGNSNTVLEYILLPFGGPITRGPVIDTSTNRIYVMSYTGIVAVVDGNTNSVIATFDTNFFCAGGWWWGNTFAANGMAINSNTHRIYVPAVQRGELLVIDGTNNSFTLVPLDFHSSGEIVVNPITNRVYVSGIGMTWENSGPVIGVLDGATNALATHIWLPFSYDALAWQYPVAMGINTTTNRIYKYGFECDPEGCHALGLATIDGNMNTVLSRNPIGSMPYDQGPNPNAFNAHIGVNPNTNLIYSTGPGDPLPGPTTTTLLAVIDPGAAEITIIGTVSATADNATLNFSNVTNPGTVSVTPISDPATAGDVPGGFAISEIAAYEITKDTTLQFSGPVTTCFSVPTVTDAATFATFRVLHRELNSTTGQYELVDRTTSSDFSTHTVCATTTSFSPFYIARQGPHIKTLFDQTKAYKSGSTVPVKLQLFDAVNNNISSAAISLNPRGLLLVGGNTTSNVIDAGQSNADGNFRYDPTLHGYIFNLSTKGLTAGQYVLSLYAGSDRSFFYAVKFEVK